MWSLLGLEKTRHPKRANPPCDSLGSAHTGPQDPSAYMLSALHRNLGWGCFCRPGRATSLSPLPLAEEEVYKLLSIHTMVHTKGNASLWPSDPQIPFLHLLCISKHMLASWSFSPPPAPPDYSSLLTLEDMGSPLHVLILLIFSVILLSQKALDMSSLFFLTDLESYRCPWIFSLLSTIKTFLLTMKWPFWWCLYCAPA